jgi:cytochrome c oxidase subunit 2
MKAIDTRDQYFGVWHTYLPIALGVFAVILLLVIFLVLRYRSRSREIPIGKDDNHPLELGYAAVLVCIAAFLIVVTFSHMPGGEVSAADHPLKVRVTAARWNWRFEYPEVGGVVDQGTKTHVPTLRVPVDTPIVFVASSLDVIHSFWIPEEKFKRDVIPGIHDRWQMYFDKQAYWWAGGVCAEFCGLEHSRMIFHVKVLSKSAFAAWERKMDAAGAGAGEAA